MNQLYRRTYLIGKDGTHLHVHGANLGVRADAYLDVGGWSDLTVSEDHCLWSRLMSRGWKLRSPASSVVITSGRVQGRATGGFADTLRRELSLSDLKQRIDESRGERFVTPYPGEGHTGEVQMLSDQSGEVSSNE